MALAVRTEKTKIIVLSKDFDGVLQPHHVALYIFADLDKKKLGEVWEATGKTPQQAVTSRYSGSLSARTSDLIIDYIIIIDKIDGMMKGYDNAVRRYIHKLFVREDIPFDALVGSIQVEDENTEALIGFNNKHLDILVKVIKDYCGIEQYFNIKEPFVYRFGQESAVEEGVSSLKKHGKCLFAGHTGFGKTSLSVKIANGYLSNGGIVLGLSPILDTIDGFRDAIEGRFCLGSDRNQEYGFVTSNNINREDLLRRKAAGEVVNVFMSIQDLTYDDIEKRYPQLNGIVDLIIEDEGHKHYGGEKTSKRLRFLEEVPILTLSATPYNIMDNFSKETIIDRGLMWALRNIKETKIPLPFIQGINTPFSCISDRLRSQYTIEEGFDPRKIIGDRENKNFGYQSELEQLPSLWYEDTRSRRKNPLTIVNDTRLSSISKKVGLIVLPEGKEGDSAKEYIPRLASLWNDNSKGRYYITSYDVANEARSMGLTVGPYVKYLLDKHPAGVSILTHRKFTTGTDIPLLGHIILLDKICDPKEFEQLMGRLIRLLEGKDHVGIYIACPDVDIQVIFGRMASKSVELHGGDVREVLDGMGLSGYDLEGNAVEYSPEDIISKIQEYYRSFSNSVPNTNAITNSLLEIDRSFFDTIDLKRVGKYQNNAQRKSVKLTDPNQSKVSSIIPSGVGFTPTDKTITVIRELMIAIGTEMVWVAYTKNNYNVMDILETEEMKKMFPSYDLDVARSTLMNKVVHQVFIKFLERKREAYSTLSFEEVHDDIFTNTVRKRKIGLVYLPMSLASSFLDEDVEREYNKGKRIFIIGNALSGSLPLAVRKKYPNARIICDEFYEPFKPHLNSMGFELWNNQMIDRKKVICLGNPPYSNTSAITTHNSNLDSEFYLKCMERGSYVKEIIRSKHFVTKNCLFRKKLFGSGHMKSIVYLPDTTFPTVSGTEFCIAEWDEDHTGLTSITYDNGTVLHQQLNENSFVKLNNPDFDKEVKNNLADRWIRGKLNLKEIVDGDSPMVKELGKGKTPVVVNVPAGLEETARNRHGVVMANVNGSTATKGLIKVMVKPYEASIAAGIICLLTNSQEESEILRDYLLSEEVTETIKKCVPTRTRSHLLFSKIKDPLV